MRKLKTFVLAISILALECSLSQVNTSRSVPSSQSSGSPLEVANRNGSRPLDRPSLSLVQQQDGGSSGSETGPLGKLDSPADWFLMGGGSDDLMTSEARSVASLSSSDYEPRNHSSSRRSGHRVKPSSAGKSSGSQQNKTMFDDEQSSEASDSNEIFDDAEESSNILAGSQKVPECATNGRYYCTYKEDYPHKLVLEVTKYYKWPLEKLFRDLHAQIMPKLAQDSTGNLVCDSITRVVRPGWARNTNDRWLVVINTENYHQYVTEVVCQYGTNSRCNFIPPCYYSSCQQRYNTQKLLVIDPTNPYRGPFLSEFLFPSCCVCYVPSASDSYQDKYRSSPATIYQRTMQQESASNQYPPQYRPSGLMDDVTASALAQEQNFYGSSVKLPSSPKQAIPPQAAPSGQAPGPGEIRRRGDLSRHQESAPVTSFSSQNERGTDNLRNFPRLGLTDVSPDQTTHGGNLDKSSLNS